MGECFVAEAHVRCVPDEQQFVELRVAVLGNGGAGKSTLLGVLSGGVLDNGRGLARLNLFRHKHEIESGRTSCISHEVMGFNDQGQPVYATRPEDTQVTTSLSDDAAIAVASTASAGMDIDVTCTRVFFLAMSFFFL